jgi:hypothetical protein
MGLFQQGPHAHPAHGESRRRLLLLQISGHPVEKKSVPVFRERFFFVGCVSSEKGVLSLKIYEHFKFFHLCRCVDGARYADEERRSQLR